MKIPMTAAVTLLAALTVSLALTACGTTAPPPAHRHVDELGAPNIPVRVPGAAQCPTASTLGQNIAYRARLLRHRLPLTRGAAGVG
jgi:hypothetical protein